MLLSPDRNDNNYYYYLTLQFVEQIRATWARFNRVPSSAGPAVSSTCAEANDPPPSDEPLFTTVPLCLLPPLPLHLLSFTLADPVPLFLFHSPAPLYFLLSASLFSFTLWFLYCPALNVVWITFLRLRYVEKIEKKMCVNLLFFGLMPLFKKFCVIFRLIYDYLYI